MIERAEQVGMIEPRALLPTGVIVGSAAIDKVSRVDEVYRWHLTDVQRAKKFRKPTGHPQPVWSIHSDGREWQWHRGSLHWTRDG